MKKTIGIIGGMGPLATCDLMEKIIAATNAETDQDNIHLVIDCNTEIPDRTEAILNHGASPVGQIVRSGIKLQGMGADLLVMPCNTAHYFYDNIVPFFDIPLLNMIEETAGYLKKQGVKKAGLLATDGTLQSGVYKKAMAQSGIQLLVPDAGGQKAVMEMIYDGVKSGNADFPSDDFQSAVKGLLSLGAETIILGCTELPVAMKHYQLDYPSVDPTEILARAAVRYCVPEQPESLNLTEEYHSIINGAMDEEHSPSVLNTVVMEDDWSDSIHY